MQTTCSLLIPENLVQDFYLLKNKVFSVRNLLHKLVTMEIPGHANVATNRVTIIYQNKFLHLEKVNFRPVEKDWLRLRLLAGIKGVSMARMFVELMVIYLKNVGVPAKNHNFTLIYKITTSSNYFFIKSFYNSS